MTKTIKTLALAATAALALITSASAEPAKPRVLVLQPGNVEFKVWGLPPGRHFTADELFKSPASRCATHMAQLSENIAPDILAKLKAKHPTVQYWYHVECLDEAPTN